MFNLEAALLVEGLSGEAKKFHRLIKKILSIPPRDLLRFVAAPTEGVMHFGFISEDATPKGEIAELARGKTHRVVTVRFQAADTSDLFFYFVIPLKDLSGEEITDKSALSSIQRKVKAINTDLVKGVEGTELELDAIFKDKRAAIARLKEIDHEVAMAGESPVNLIAKDPVRHIIGNLIGRFFPDKAQKYISALAALDTGSIQAGLDKFSWNASNIPLFTRAAAAMIAGADTDNPQTVKRTAELALATMATQLLDAEEIS